MNGVAMMVALLAAPDAMAFGKHGCGCGLFHGRVRAFVQMKLHGGLFSKCRCRNAVWTAPAASSCGCGGYDVGGLPPVPVSHDPFPGGFAGGPPLPVGGPAFPHGGPAFADVAPWGGPPGAVIQGFPSAMSSGAFPSAPVPHPAAMPSGPSTGWTMPSLGADPSAIPPVLGQPNAVPTPLAPGGAGSGVSPSIPPANGAKWSPTKFLVPTKPVTLPAGGVAPASATAGDDLAPARLVFQVPEGAAVFVDGQPLAGSGPVRRFHTPGLPRGRTFFYEFKAVVELNGVKMVEEKVVPVCAGDELGESFGKLAAVAGR